MGTTLTKGVTSNSMRYPSENKSSSRPRKTARRKDRGTLRAVGGVRGGRGKKEDGVSRIESIHFPHSRHFFKNRALWLVLPKATERGWLAKTLWIHCAKKGSRMPGFPALLLYWNFSNLSSQFRSSPTRLQHGECRGRILILSATGSWF